MLDKVRELGLDPLVIYTADHGDMFLSHGIMGKGCVMYNEVTRVPFLMKGGRLCAGEKYNPRFPTLILLPTLMAHFGVQVPKMMQAARCKA